ncbi:sugar ABC transporter permease [Mesorhizobium sp. M4B.F.Ca.ET.017.02.2.1]|uniref:carbohydrate ABC transporter permease n=1 Tax=Mesorhizobium sp. M4B.F.Ca.ET.017.02.2.1 TaxID=2496649 RepID=UPI000FCBFD87|nr:sugar ABC transporter permease [Mesorhizobium sp. M4B.F.Ca.ET.017.02.2.1]RVD30975.1 sugar ABC transporter permease [Mesorhizobium sp. M4B.F.Ca.ET.017.02.2.1]
MSTGAVSLERRRVRTAWIFLSPAIAVFAAVAAWPLLRTIWLGLTDAGLGAETSGQFIGFSNFLAHDQDGWSGLLVDRDWWRAVFNTVTFAGISVVLETVIGFALALLIDREFPGRGLLRAAILIPWAIPTIVAAKLWGWMLNDQYGIVNHVLLMSGVIHEPVAWIANPAIAYWTVIIADVWKETPYMTLLILAGLQMLPRDCFEAARIDGAGPWTILTRITLPLIWPALIVAVTFRALDALRVFDVIYVLTSNNKRVMSMSMFARRELIDFQLAGYGSAAATLLFLTIAAMTIMFLTATRSSTLGKMS